MVPGSDFFWCQEVGSPVHTQGKRHQLPSDVELSSWFLLSLIGKAGLRILPVILGTGLLKQGTIPDVIMNSWNCLAE
jgi:hypothetical protein